MRRLLAVPTLACLTAASLLALQTQDPPTFRAAANLVEVIVRVTDSQGQFVPNLTLKDFELREQGRPETVVAFDYVNLPREPTRTAAAGRPVLASPEMSTVSTNAGVTDARLFVLLFDDLHIAPIRTLQTRTIAREFVERHVSPSDLVAAFSTSGRGVMTQEFTTDRVRVLAAADQFFGARIRCCENEAETVYHARAATDVIQSLVGHLAPLRGRRTSLLWMSEGVDYDLSGQHPPTGCVPRMGGAVSPDLMIVAQALQRAVDSLRSANITVYAVDPRRLASDTEITNEMAPLCGPLPGTPREILARSIDNLRSISEQTGGFAAVNTNEFREPFERVVDEASQYYVLGFQPSRPGKTGEVRRIEVRVTGRPRLRVSARSAYVVPPTAPPTPRPMNAAAILADALMRTLPMTGLPLSVQAIPRRGQGELGLVHIVAEISGKDLTFAEANGRHQERLEFALRTSDSLARVTGEQTTTVTLNLAPAEFTRLRNTGVRWLSTLEMKPGRYNLRVVAHGTETDKTGSVFVDIDVPKVEDEKLWIGGLALTSLPAALAVTGGNSPATLGLPTPPTTTRTFLVGDTVTVSAELATPQDFTTGTLQLTVHRTGAAANATAVLDRTHTLTDRAMAQQSRAWAVPTSVLGTGSFVLRLTARDVKGESASTAVLFEVIER